MFFKPFKNIS